MKPHAMTEQERSLVVMALRDKCNTDTELSRIASDKRLAEQFTRQAYMASSLADQIDGSDLVDIWPYDEENDPDAYVANGGRRLAANETLR